MKKKTKITLFLILDSILVSCLTIYIASLSDLLVNNFSDLANGIEYQALLYLWSVVTSGSTCFILYLCKPKLKSSIIMLLFLLLNAVIFWPYLPDYFPVMSQLHIVVGYIAFVGLNMVILQELFYYSLYDNKKGGLLLKIFIMLLFILALIVMVFGIVNSLFEVIYTCGTLATLVIYYIFKEEVV